MTLPAESSRRVVAVAVFVLAFVLSACTPLPSPSDNSQTAGDAGPDAADGRDRDGEQPDPGGDRCELDGETRCTEGARARERCEDGRWTATDGCAEGEVCTSTGSMAGRCVAVIDACRGNASANVCDPEGTMYRCGAGGAVESSEACPSARHCQLGLAAESCAACLPGEVRCSGDSLEVCDAGAREFRPSEACPAGTCDAALGMCRGAACPEQRAICDGDVLKICPKGATSFSEVARCEPGLCNAAAARCDACLPGTRVCEGETAVTCSDDGSQRERRDCALDQVHCVGAGQCVECGRDADCATSNSCQSAVCDLVQGVCQTEAKPVRSPCPEGMCSPAGACVACLTEQDCPAGGACEARACDPATHTCQLKPAKRGTSCGEGVCDASGRCVGCVDDDGCPPAGECQIQHCDAGSKRCEPMPAPDGQACNGSFGAGRCDGGQCVQCRGDGDCGAAAECEQSFCRTSDRSCQRRPSPAGAACGGGNVCDGSRQCVECTSNLHCGANATCRDDQCTCNPGFVANPTGNGCNFDECQKFDDNRCAASSDTGNTCTNTVDGYDCACAAPWKLGDDQCFQGGGASDVHTVPNGASFSVLPNFVINCQNAFDRNTPCTPGQLTWLNLCGLPDVNPADCSTIRATGESLAVVNLKRVNHSGPLQNYGEPNGAGEETVLLPAVGDVILVHSLVALYVMRIRSLDAAGMTFEWATIVRDACWRPGGLSCSAACSCPGGT